MIKSESPALVAIDRVCGRVIKTIFAGILTGLFAALLLSFPLKTLFVLTVLVWLSAVFFIDNYDLKWIETTLVLGGVLFFLYVGLHLFGLPGDLQLPF